MLQHGAWLYYDVACKSTDEYLFDDMWRQWNEEYAELFEDFHAFLEAQPYLGTTHPLGMEIYKSITKFPRTTLTRETWYRARSVKDGRALRSTDFHAPNPTKHAIGEGRFHHHGKSVLYLAKTPEGAAVEAISPDESVAWVQKFKITKLRDVLDLTNMDVLRCEGLPVLAVGLIHSGVLERNPNRDGSWKPEYLVPRYISDCARSAGFKGIRFNAAQHYRQNLVIFHTAESGIATSRVPKLVSVKETDRRSRLGADDEDF